MWHKCTGDPRERRAVAVSDGYQDCPSKTRSRRVRSTRMEERQSAQRNSGRQGPHSAVWRLSGCLLKIGVSPITDDLAASVPPPPKPALDGCYSRHLSFTP